MDNWYLLYTTRDLTKANIVKGMLEENDVPAMLVNKQSSSYIIFGDIELYVPDYLKDLAKELVEQEIRG